MSSESWNKPWVLIDRIIECNNDGENAIILKNISSSDSYLLGHFPNYSIYPGMLLVGGIIQASELLIKKRYKRNTLTPVLIKSRFLYPVTPGDQIEYYIHLVKNEEDICTVKAEGKLVGTDHLIVKVELMIRMEL
ncbi:MAG: 3-hydroxyacyl-ACP dehydratase FabZ family protein [Bacillota bacterium]